MGGNHFINNHYQKNIPQFVFFFCIKKKYLLINTEEAPREKQAKLLCNDWQCNNNNNK
jgi:hypothetical protein